MSSRRPSEIQPHASEPLTGDCAPLAGFQLRSPVSASDQVRESLLDESLGDLAGIGVWRVDASGGAVGMSEKGASLVGLSPGDRVTVDTIVGRFVPEARGRIRKLIGDALAQPASFSFEEALEPRNDRGSSLRVAGRSARTDEGHSLICTVRDGSAGGPNALELTEALEAARVAVSAKTAYQTALDKYAIVAITDRRGDIIFVNDRFCEISGYSQEELVGNNHRILNSGHHSREFFHGLWRAIAKGTAWHGEICNRKKDGGLYWVDTTIVPLVGRGGKIEQFVSVRYEITERKAADEERQVMLEALNERSQAAEAATVAKGQFLAAMSRGCVKTPSDRAN